jgi:hypothetical protein
MLSAIVSAFGGEIIGKLFGTFGDIIKRWQDKQISEVEAKQAMVLAMVAAFKDIEVAHAEALTKTYATFWAAADTDKSNLMKIMWAAALGSQIFVLFWSQFCVPLLFAYGFLPNWKAGTTAEWSYLLIGALLGLGPMVLRSGPSAGTITERLKAMIGK